MNSTQTISEVHDQAALIAKIRASHGTDAIVQTSLRTSQRVIARVTDGIYRQPGSAIRELISNAYDADATKVSISTEAPRFERIIVEDDGHGMSPEALAYLLQNIGGSAKRKETGAALGMTSESDPRKSPNGRMLIGKIGIGLFSVSQLTNSFQIITKTKGDDFRTVATVVMRQYADEFAATQVADLDQEFESGKVNIWREKAADIDVHGTTIILNSIRRQARDTLRSHDIWSVIEHDEHASPDERQEIAPPKFHIGRIDSSGKLLRLDKAGASASLPWEPGDEPRDAFKKLVRAVWDEVGEGNPNPKLDSIFDYYLRMAWQLALAVPLPYVDGHLFDEIPDGWARSFLISNSPKGAAEERPGTQESLREKFALATKSTSDFRVLFDQLELSHPILYKDLPTTSSALKEPLIFVGKVNEEFPKIPLELSAGPLSFEAYLFWSPKIAPVEHQGSLVRVNGASGTLFDPTFMRYQVAEVQRLKQITCEIFVHRGLDSALNIDRESFNVAHPHAVYITKWLHSALRQLASAQKRVASEIRGTARDARELQALSAIQEAAQRAWQRNSADPTSLPPAVILSVPDLAEPLLGEAYVFDRDAVVQRPGTQRRRDTASSRVAEEKLKAIAQVLASFDLLDNLPKKRQQELLNSIFEILEWSGE